ncbi:MAG: GNAT family N-acetyltransferase [Anaerolineae bacterium]|jgi:predicted acetyltransferase|nr:GNAT family N-acetyltransferase [Anaerolineae bacterium]
MSAASLVRSVLPQEVEAAGDLVARVFARGDARRYERLLHHRLTHLPHKPGFAPDDYRAAFVDGRPVSVIRVVYHTLHYGRARLRVAGIVDVATDPAYRHRGLSAAVLLDTLMHIAEQGAHLALLYDAAGYYRRYGFSPLLPDYALTFPVAAALALRPAARLRPAGSADLPAVAALYRQQRAGHLLFQRSAAQWLWLYQAAHTPPLLAEDDQGDLCGYLWRGDDDDGYTEVVATTTAATLTLMRQAAEWHQAAGLPRVAWQIPPDDPLIACALPLLPVTIQAAYQPDRGWLGRLVQPQALLLALLPELAAQAKFMLPAFEDGRLLLAAETDVVVVGDRAVPASRCHIAHRDFIQVMFGVLRPAALAYRTPLTADQVALLELLFPARVAALTAWDWF